MKRDGTWRRARLLLLPAAAAFLGACGGGGDSPVQAAAPNAAIQAEDTRPAQPAGSAGRLLASNCFQCHGTGGTGGFDSIRGSEASEVWKFLEKPATSGVMAAHVQGYTRAQLDAIVAYLQQR